MLRKHLVMFLGTLFVFFIAAIGFGAWYFRGAWPVISPPPESIVELMDVNKLSNIDRPSGEPLNWPLVVAPGFEITIFAKNLPGARVIAEDYRGNLWVSETGKGKVVMVEVRDGKAIGMSDVFTKLKNPHGLAFDPEDPGVLYIAEENAISKARVLPDPKSISRFPTSTSDIEIVRFTLMLSSVIQPAKVIDLPGGGRHTTRTIGFGPDGKLFVSIGSSCDVCNENDNKRAAIYFLNKDGTDFHEFARGLRNSVFFTWNELGEMWATEMGRDNLGDDLPPDEINQIEFGKNYGWPICYGKNVHDDAFDKNTYIRNPCMEPFEIGSRIDLPAHVAPLGLGFVPREGWPEEYHGDLLVALHGSWNSTKPAGYKVVRIKFDERGEVVGVEDFITGWLTDKNRALGRPVTILAKNGGIMYISDDKAGVIYQVLYRGK